MSKKNHKKSEVAKEITKKESVEVHAEKEETAEVTVDVTANDTDEKKNFWQKITYFLKYSIQTWIVRCLFIAFDLELLMEILGRRSLVLGVKFMISSPIVFLYNTSIIFFTLLFALFLRKRIFGIVLISVVWLICGIANFVVLGYRITPFAAIDLLMVKDVISMLDVYFSKVQQVLLVVAAVAVIVGIVILFRKSPKFEGKKHVVRTMVTCIAMWIGIMFFTNFNVNHNIISDDFANLGMAYQDYGFAYCFTNSIIDNGISKPDDYNEATMLHLRNKLNSKELDADASKKKTPNIVCVQLESFFDPNVVEGLTLSENPIPNFTRLKEKYPSGYLTMPALGAGTANSEFEVLTGIRSAYFGAGEYPYKTTVNKVPVEGMCSLLEKEGYHTFAMHNNKSSFYDRKDVYNEMGFERFISLEYMYNVEKTSTGWAKDEVLVDNIKNCLRSTEGPDFVFTISVQGHGKYPEELGACDEQIKVSYPQDPVKENQLTYYVNQLHEMDQMIHDLITALDNTGEEYVLLLYGDHLPTITFDDDQLPHSQFQTEYILVNNMNLDIPDEDIRASEVSTKIFQALNLDMGYVQRAHCLYQDDEEELDHAVTLLAYDMLYGEDYIYDGQSPVPEVGQGQIIMGLEEIGISRVSNEGDHAVVRGRNFNEYSKVYIGDDECDTVYVDRNTLMVQGQTIGENAEVTVKQVDESGHVLSSTDGYTFH